MNEILRTNNSSHISYWRKQPDFKPGQFYIPLVNLHFKNRRANLNLGC